MSSHEHFVRSPMASRRVRRHANGVSNAQSVDDGASSISRNTVSIIHADRVVKLPQHLRPSDPAARETRVEDRPTLNRLHDKLFATHRPRFVRKVLRSHAAPDGSGLLGRESLRAALAQLHVGLDRAERERVIARVAPEEDSRVHYSDVMRLWEVPQPLGDEHVAVARGMSVPGPPVVRPGGGGSGVGDGGVSYWNWQRYPQGHVPGLLDEVREGTAEQARSDELLMSVLASKLGNCRDKLRTAFRNMDRDHNSRIDREEFARGVAALRLDASRPQLDRLFDLTDRDRDGVIDYSEFAAAFGGEDNPLQGRSKAAGGGASGAAAGAAAPAAAAAAVPPPPLTQSLGLSPDEVQGAMRHPLVLELARAVHGRGTLAATPFKQVDGPCSGRLDVRGMTAACRALVPGIGERQVAALMAAVDPASSEQVDYRVLLSRLAEDAPAHPRLPHHPHSAPPGGSKGGGGGGSGGGGGAKGALARFGETLTVPAPLPTPYTRALSAVSLSRRPETTTITTDMPYDSSSSSAGPPSPPACDNVYKIHQLAIAPFLESIAASSAAGAAGVSHSVDLGSLARSGQQPVAAAAAVVSSASGSRVPSHATGRFSRFWSRRYADTSSLTSAHPASAAVPPPEGAFLRKGDHGPAGGFLRFQAQDREREARRREQHVRRYVARSEVDSRYSAQDDASGADEGRLAVARAARQRYEERCEMYDRLRQMRDPSEHAFFGRLPVFKEHTSDTANQPVRANQTRSYW